MGKFVGFEPCGQCGSRDNVGVWDDGKYCFGCHWTHSDHFAAFRARLEDIAKYTRPDGEGVALPYDFDINIPKTPVQWLLKYLNKNDILQHDIVWSDSKCRLIFPVYRPKDKGREVVLWAGRYFGTKIDEPKWFIQGSKQQVMDVVSSNALTSRLVAVEDKVSAIKVSCAASTYTMYGTKFPTNHAVALGKTYEELILWLDKDMRPSALRQAIQLQHFFKRTRVIFSERDPKCYSPKEINDFLGNN